MNKSKIYVIIIPGLLRREKFLTKLKDRFIKKGIEAEVYNFKWLGVEKYEDNLITIKDRITRLEKNGYKVVILGTSAGASIGNILFFDSDIKIHKLITICGPLKDTDSKWFNFGKRISPTWAVAIKNSSQVGNNHTNNVLNIIPIFDDLIPLDAMYGKNSRIIRFKGYMHLFSIRKATIILEKELVEFILS